MSFEVPEWGATNAFDYHLDLSNDTPKVENLVSQAMRENDRKRENDGASPKKAKKKQKVTDVPVQKDHKEATEKIGKKKRKKGEKTEKRKADGNTKNESCSVDEATEPPAKKRCKNKYKELNEDPKKRKLQAVNTIQKESENDLPLSSNIIPRNKSKNAQDQLVGDLENGNVTKAKKKKRKMKEVEAKSILNGAEDTKEMLQPQNVNGVPKKRKKHKKSGCETLMEESVNETKGNTSVEGAVETETVAAGEKKISKKKKALNVMEETSETKDQQEILQNVNKKKKKKKKQNEETKEGYVPEIKTKETENFNGKEACVNETDASVEEAVKSKDEIRKQKSKKQKKTENEAVIEAKGPVAVVEMVQVKGVNGISKKKKQKKKNESAKENSVNETNGETLQAENINGKTKKIKKQKKDENKAAKVESMAAANQQVVQAENKTENETKKQNKTQNKAVKEDSTCKDTKNVKVMKDSLQEENKIGKLSENQKKKQKKKQKKASGETIAVVKKEPGMPMPTEGGKVQLNKKIEKVQLNKNTMIKNGLKQTPVKESGKKMPKVDTESSKKLIIEEETTVSQKKEKKKKKKKKPKNAGEKALLNKDPNFRAELDTFLDSLDIQQEDLDTEDEEEWQVEEEEDGEETLPGIEDSEDEMEKEEKNEPDNEKNKAKVKDKKLDKKQIAEVLEAAGDIEANKDTPKKEKKFDKRRLLEILEDAPGGDEAKPELVLTPKEKLKLKMTNQLSSARFRMLNEELYKTTSDDAAKMFKQDPEAFHTYHQGYQNQVALWPINPLELIIKWLNKKSADWVVADFGCGEAKLAASVHQKKVHSFDLVAANKRVTACDMANTPLPAASVNVVVFCLSLMGTNITDFIIEANRVLKQQGVMKIAEVESRFTDVNEFINQINQMGFHCTYKNIEQKFFHCFDFKKEKNIKKKAACPPIVLNPCLYKKR